MRNKSDRIIRWAMGGFLAVLLILYVGTNFRGLEYQYSYCGNAYQALHPESFPNNPYMSPTRPTMLSLYYTLVRFSGELWLDDRFTLLVYAGLVVLALAAVNKTAILLGAGRFSERVCVLALMVLTHNIHLSNIPDLVSPKDFNATTMAAPVGLWVLYVSLARKRLPVIFGWTLLLWLLSIKNAWCPTLIALAILYQDRIPSSKKPFVAAAAALCALLLFGWYRGIFHPDVAKDAQLFDYLHTVFDNAEADPFMDPLEGQLAFVALCLGSVGLGFLRKDAVFQRVGIVGWVGLAVWGLGGLYMNVAPDFFKVPYLLPLNFTRGLWWPQYVFYMGIAATCLAAIQRGISRPKVFAALGILAALYFIPFRLKRMAFFGLALVLLWGLRRLTGRLRDPLRVLAIALGFTTVSALTYSAATQWPHFRFLIRHGIMGDNPGSNWVGVNEYIRQHTAPSATVLALSTRSYYWRPRQLAFDNSIQTRTGRNTPVGPAFVFYFDYDKMVRAMQRSEWASQLVQQWEAHDLPNVVSALRVVGFPDYLVVPSQKADWVPSKFSWPYRVEAVIGEFTIFRKQVEVLHGI